MEREAPIHRIPDFIARLRSIPTPDTTRTLWGVCMAEKSVLKTYKNADGERYAIASVRRTLTDYRNAIRAEFGDKHAALNYMRLGNDDMEDLRDSYRATVDEMHESLRPIDADALVAEATAIIERPRDFKTMDVAAALLLLTGRRVTEILKTAVFTPGSKARTLVFAGQLKKKDSDPDFAPLEIPVLAKADTIMDALAYVRLHADCTDVDNRGVNDRYSKYVSAAVKVRYADANGEAVTAKDLRAMYATIAYAWYAPNTMWEMAYFAKILGHSELDRTTSLSYKKFFLVGQKRAAVADFRWSLDMTMALLQDKIEDEADAAKRGWLEKDLAILEQMRAKA